MTKENLTFKNVETESDAEPGEGTSASEQASSTGGKIASIRRLWPVYYASAASFAWLAAAGYVAWASGLFSPDAGLSLINIAALVAGAATPVSIFWLVALVFQRTDPLLERRLAIAQGIDRTLAPIDSAQDRIADIAENIKRQAGHIEMATDLATSRLDVLENRFKEQINDLFSATTDAEAKAVTIKDVLKRERDAMASLSDDLSDRIETIENAIAALTSEMRNATGSAKTEAEAANSLLRLNTEGLKLTAEEATEILTQAGSELERYRTSLEKQVADSESRVAALSGHMDEEGGRMAERMAALEEKAGAITDALSKQTELLTSLAARSTEQSEAIEQTITRQAGHLKQTASEALSEAGSVGEAFEQQATEMTRTVRDAVDQARSMLDDAGQAFEHNAAAAGTASEKAASIILSQADHTVREMEKRSEKMQQVMDAALSRASLAFDETGEKLAGKLDTTEKSAAATTSRILEKLEQSSTALKDHIASIENTADGLGAKALSELEALRAELEIQSKASGETTATHTEALERLARSLADQADMIASSAKEAADNMRDAGGVMDDRSANLGQALAETKRNLGTIEQEIADQRAALIDASEQSASVIIDAVGRFQEQTGEIEKAAQEAQEALGDGTEKLTEYADALTLRNDGFQDSLESTRDAIIEVAEILASERSKLVDDTEKTVGRIEHGAARLGGRLIDVAESSKAALENLDKARDQIDTIADGIGKTVIHAGESAAEAAYDLSEGLDRNLGSASEKVQSSIQALRDKMEGNLSELSGRFERELNDTMVTLHAAAKEANLESEKVSNRIADQANRLIVQAERFAERKSEMEKTFATATRDDFVRTSSLLIESLNSTAIDINKILETDIPDDLWKKYLDGDRSVFSRRAVRLASKKDKSILSKKFDQDAEFRDHVVKFLRDFEALMERVMAGDSANILSVTLVSSEMGKLYVLLAQSLKKLGK